MRDLCGGHVTVLFFAPPTLSRVEQANCAGCIFPAQSSTTWVMKRPVLPDSGMIRFISAYLFAHPFFIFTEA